MCSPAPFLLFSWWWVVTRRQKTEGIWLRDKNPNMKEKFHEKSICITSPVWDGIVANRVHMMLSFQDPSIVNFMDSLCRYCYLLETGTGMWYHMMTGWYGNAFHAIGPLWGGVTDDQRIRLTKSGALVLSFFSLNKLLNKPSNCQCSFYVGVQLTINQHCLW